MDLSVLFGSMVSIIFSLLGLAAYVFYALGLMNVANSFADLKVPSWCAWIPFAQTVLLADIISKKMDKKIGNMELYLVTIIALGGTFILSLISCGILSFLFYVIIVGLNVLFVINYAPENDKMWGIDIKILFIIFMIIYPYLSAVAMYLAPQKFGFTE